MDLRGSPATGTGAPSPPERPDSLRWADEERELICALGGFALHLSGGWLVTHERLPGSRFNFIDIGALNPARRTAFLERALDHYFQRALRPVVRLSPRAPEAIVGSLERLGFRERSTPQLLLTRQLKPLRGPASAGERVRALTPQELPILYRLWGGERELPEIRSTIDVALSAPSPGEEVVPVGSIVEGRLVSVGLLHHWNGIWGLHAVATIPGERGNGWASDLAIQAPVASTDRGDRWLGLRVDSVRVPSHLETAGFVAQEQCRIFDLPTDRSLEVPPPGPPQPPRWRPPR